MRFFGWGPDAVDHLTVTGLLKWNAYARRCAAEAAKVARKGT